MNRKKRLWMFGSTLLMLLVMGMTAVVVLANRPFFDDEIVSPTALPLYDPFIETQAAQQTQTEAVLNPTETITPQPSPTTDTSDGTCIWQWATQANPELSAQLQQQLAEVLVNVDSVEARAESFGENCLNQDGSVRRFATMQTDYRIVVQMAILETVDPEAVQEIVNPVVLDILRVLSLYPVGSTPGPMPGQITIQFPIGSDTYEVFFTDYNTAMETLQQSQTEVAPNPTAIITPPPSPTTDPNSASCGWQWATQINPELSAQLQQQLAEMLVNVDNVEARAESFGENCLNQDGTVRRFATMQTDFRIVVQMAALENADLKAAHDIASPVVLDILRVLTHYPVGSTPGPMPGQITIQFPVRNDTYQVFFTDYNIAMDFLLQSLTVSATPDAVGSSGS